MRVCRACGHEHETLMRCDVARRIRDASAVNAAQLTKPAVNANASRGRGAYPNTDARREYMRQKMAKRRAEGKA